MLEQAMPVRKREDEVFPNAAGIDVGASSHWVAVPRHLAEESVREFGAMTDDLNALADWLIACGVDTVALESTGVYWIPVYEVLEQRGLKVWLVDARQMKYVPGRKSDVQDCQWLQKLMSLGFLRAAWRPDGEVCVVRAVARQREVLLVEQASWVQRMQKALVQMNIQLTEVLTDVMGGTGQAIIRAIVAGERDAKLLARHRHSRVKASAEEITKALTGNWREEHLFVLRQAVAMYDGIGQHLAECDTKLHALLGELGQRKVDLGKAPRAGSKLRVEFDARQTMANWAGVDLTRINGLGAAAVMKILSEIGPRPEPLRQRQALLLVAGAVPGHQDQRGQGAVGQDQAISQPGASGVEDGGDELVAQRLGTGRVLPPTLQSNGQTPSQHRHGAQARTHGVLHAHTRRGVRRSRPAALRRAAARALHRRTQAPRRRARLPDHSDAGSPINGSVFNFVS
jgi:transposase